VDKPASTSYSAAVRSRVTDLLSAGVTDFSRVCSACEGAFPTDVASAIAELSESGHWIRDRAGAILPGISDRLPEPHPADFEWRFTRDCAVQIARFLEQIGGRIACFGVPTVFRELDASSVQPVLVDRSPLLLEDLREPGKPSLLIDLTAAEPLRLAPFDVIAMDPPWYPDHMESWLEHALQIAKPGSILLTTLFPRLVRPTALDERESFLSLLRSVGVLEAVPFRARYETPLFELETLRGIGLPALSEWREGDLYLVRVERLAAPRQLAHPNEPKWRRFRIGRSVAVVRDNPADTWEELEIAPLYRDGSFLLQSVSARDIARNRIDFWTSRNRCVSVRGRSRLSLLLEALEQGSQPTAVLSQLPVSPREHAAMLTITALLGL
jgi:hypothetical protein